jgi:membrane-bound metal-dependent hydrolase YbcI (DUF457 family)
MDTITHGIAGALVGKAFFADGHVTAGSPRQEFGATAGWRNEAAAATGRVAVFAATLGGVFPDSDILVELFDRNRLAIIDSHRGVTHSFVCLPLWALGLALLTRGFCRWRKIPAPSLVVLTGSYAAGLAMHILLDLITSFGTMIWAPLSAMRVSWDLTFIIDFTLTAIVLLPQVAAWAYRERATQWLRALFLWGLFTLAVFGVARLARSLGLPFSPWAAPIAALLFAAILFLPAVRGWGYRVSRRAWCRASMIAFVVYLGLCFAANHVALQYVKDYAAREGLRVEQIAAIPLPPSLNDWSGLIRTPEGVHFASINLFNPRPPKFGFYGDAAPNRDIETARRLPEVQAYFRFARFPVVRYAQHGDTGEVELVDLRFFGRLRRGPQPFTFRVLFDAQGRVLSSGWADQ